MNKLLIGFLAGAGSVLLSSPEAREKLQEQLGTLGESLLSKVKDYTGDLSGGSSGTQGPTV